MRTYMPLLLILVCSIVTGQNIPPLTFEFDVRNIGPANSGGRVVDIEAHHDDFTKVYVAAASGGVWKSTNAGTTWRPIFDKYETASIGDLAIDPSNQNIVWVGTGEANNRNSVSWGNGIYKSVDGGNTFENKGLQSTHQISRVLVHPRKSDEVCVCAIGHLWGYSGDRGLFKTSDGGKTWSKKTKGLPDDGKTGCTDLVRDSKNPNVLYAAFYHRLRRPWHFQSGGDQGGIYKSTDGGETWKRLSNGLPEGATGRIGLAIYDKNPNILMAIIEAKKTHTLSIPGSGIYRSENAGATWKYINTYNDRPFYYSQIRINPLDDKRVYVLTTKFMVSKDGGHTFADGSADQEVHGDFHALWFDPANKDRYYLGADKGFSLTHDHGQHFQLLDNIPITQYYSINYDMQEPYMVYGGLQDNGSYATPSFARDARGILNDYNWKMHWGDGQEAAVNPFDPNDAYTSMENGRYFKYNPTTRNLKMISPSYGNIENFDQYFKSGDTIRDVMRFNWSTPFVMSPKDPSCVYLAGNHVYKSINRGMSWTIISPDLSTNDRIKRKQGVSGGITPDNTGAETYCTVVSLSVSPIREHTIWAGTDDGLVHVTKDGGKLWHNVTKNIPSLPEGMWVSRIEASGHHPSRAYVTFDGHRSDQLGTWIYYTEDEGVSWHKITSGIDDEEVVRSFKEDLINENLLFIGTETGVWYSLDRGMSWIKMKGLPTVSVYDLKIHRRDHDLIIGTHGRGIWVVDDISPLQQWKENIKNKSIHIFEQRPTVLWTNISRGGQRGHFWWAGKNPSNIRNTSSIPRAEFKVDVPIHFYVGSENMDSAHIKIYTRQKDKVFQKMIKVRKGLNVFYWNREFDGEAYNSEELDRLIKYFNENIKKDNTNILKSAYDRFMRARDPMAKRRIVQSIIENSLNSPLETHWGIQEAGDGYYNMQISGGNAMDMGHFVIKEDPLAKK